MNHTKNFVFTNFIIFSLFVLSIFLSAGTANAESIFLKDGSVIEGKITKESDSSISITTPNQLKVEIPRTSIIRILTGEDYKQKVDIVMIDKTKINAYIVDQTSEKYIVRNELSSAGELNIPKKDIMEITREGKQAHLDRIVSKKGDISPKKAIEQSIIPLRSGSFLVGYNGIGAGFCLIKTGAFMVPLSFLFANAIQPPGGDTSSDDSSSNKYDYMNNPQTQKLILGALGIWVLATTGDMIYSYYHVKNYNEKQQKASLDYGAIRFSVIPKIHFSDTIYNRKAACDGVYVSISAAF
ncbi:MAG: hypothetical protein ACYDH2_15580 [Anaerolineaceae bacterium]